MAHEIIVRAIQLGGPAEEKGGDWKVEKVVSLIAKTESARLQHRNPFGYQDTRENGWKEETVLRGRRQQQSDRTGPI